MDLGLVDLGLLYGLRFVGITPTNLQVTTEHDQKTEIIEYLKGSF